MKRIVGILAVAICLGADLAAEAQTTIKVCLTPDKQKAKVTIGLIDSRTADVTIGLLDSRAVDIFIGIVDSPSGANIVIESEDNPEKANLALRLVTDRNADKTICIRDSRAVDKTVCLRDDTRLADLVVCVKDPVLRVNKHALVAIFEHLGILQKKD